MERGLMEKPGTEREEPTYTRKYGLIQRLYQPFLRPSTVMKDIALSPDYRGIGIIVALQFIWTLFSVISMISKIHFTGPHAQPLALAFTFGMVISIGFLVLFLPIRWLIKSAIVWKACRKGSKWGFKKAASVTGYAYVVELIGVILSGIIGIITLYQMPTIQIDTSDLQAALPEISQVQEQIQSTKLYGLPISFAVLLWKSYLGGVGTHFGTQGKCTKLEGTVIFLLLGLITFLLGYYQTFIKLFFA